MGKILHIMSSLPSQSNRLSLQLRYAEKKWITELIYLGSEQNTQTNFENKVTTIKCLPNWPKKPLNSNYLISKLFGGLRIFINYVKLIQTLIRSDADILHAHENNTLWIAVFWVKVLGRNLVWDPHDYFHEALKKGVFGSYRTKIYFERLLIKNNIPVIVVSSGMKRLYNEMYNYSNLTLIQSYPHITQKKQFISGINFQKEILKILGKRLNNFDGRIRIVYPGQIKPDRIELDFIKKIGLSKNVSLDLFGYDPNFTYTSQILSYIEQNNITNIRLMGRYTPSNIIEILQDYHFAIFPYPNNLTNISICLPNKFYQCIEATLPIVVSDMEELGSIVNNYSLGYVFPSKRYENVEKFFNEFVLSSHEYEKMVSNVLSYSQYVIDYNKQQQDLLKLYSEICNNN